MFQNEQEISFYKIYGRRAVEPLMQLEEALGELVCRWRISRAKCKKPIHADWCVRDDVSRDCMSHDGKGWTKRFVSGNMKRKMRGNGLGE